MLVVQLMWSKISYSYSYDACVWQVYKALILLSYHLLENADKGVCTTQRHTSPHSTTQHHTTPHIAIRCRNFVTSIRGAAIKMLHFLGATTSTVTNPTRATDTTLPASARARARASASASAKTMASARARASTRAKTRARRKARAGPRASTRAEARA
jgi:hypothetical protein